MKKTTKVYKIKFGKASYLNNYVGTYKLRKGSIVKTVYYGRNSFKWLLRGSKKFKSNGKYAYTADFKKNSFKVISHSN
ncbi:hypothetical protein FD37_GL000695 [Levilactobacillus spicheri DSM 15429]|uniref:Uncharacterized protein n=1 Tax=Levilactobacillus spicheri DSM 15429 TaxID=1423805 RepID=A0A0R1QUH7_9LACO|nr:hypothetical protein FD37_GL000695 [Levilactobacillus spicheri DSM 15429]